MQNNTPTGQNEEYMKIQDLLQLCLAKWRWFAVSLSIALGIAVLYLLITPPVYTRSADILIKEDSNGNSPTGDFGSFADLGLFQANSNVNNELISLQSPATILEVVKRLHLDVDYSTDGSFHDKVLYGKDLPFNISFLDLADHEAATLTLKETEDGRIQLSDFTRDDEDMDNGESCSGQAGDTLHTPLGRIVVQPTLFYPNREAAELYVSRNSLYDTVDRYTQSLTVTLKDEKATVISLSCQDVSIQRAEDILNTLISVYNENWVKDKNQVATSTSHFISERLKVIEQELGNVDEDISSYKSEHLLPDVQAASNLYMTQASETSSHILELNNQLYMANYIRNYLANESNKNQLLPANSGIDNANIEKLISEYNDKQIQRNSLIANSSERNPLVADLDRALASMRQSILHSIDNQVVTLKTQIHTFQQSERQNTARIAASPTQAKYLLSVERQQKVKESLYLFLLQKREENELSQAFTAYNTRIITPPLGQMKPTAPVRRNILLVAFAIGILLPALIIFIRENMNSTVRSRKDIENMTVPFIGEIPQIFQKKKRFSFRKQKEEPVRTIAVKEKSRNIINEAFRVIRTNLEFMTGREGKIKVIMLTSANPGSGKTFIAMNLATSFAIKGKKVLVIDLDIRKASLSTYIDSPHTGISDYLSGQADTWQKIIIKGKTHPNLDVIPVGTLPPNPAELLSDERLAQMLNALRSEYDYIFVDCPPVEIVADASIINKLTDMTLFIIRAGLLERVMLPEIERFYTEHKYKNLSLILNGIENTHGRYGYRYGYSYGYGNDNDE
ncbi:polysaccharide biosynthesis tyrosine autokinase [uncultured Bacteroides sp.]|jgi:capsular exopolysaccharide family|uniref:GumC family protein n=1 Tax=uncultured Bacteroides sp. TaxID=162156 RepID=UPI00280B61B2|nr:polysaccharide biosynthesis tyrosine autokinase [uncultured Bacteroides sp.]